MHPPAAAAAPPTQRYFLLIIGDTKIFSVFKKKNVDISKNYSSSSLITLKSLPINYEFL
jgi:hypothetical protein